jgi:hypothetical protein
MTIIKGPIKFKGGIPISRQITEHFDNAVKNGEMKHEIPFSATGWKSTKNADKVNVKEVK